MSRLIGDVTFTIGKLLLTTADREKDKTLDQARKIFEGLKHGPIERSVLTPNAYFTEQALKDSPSNLAPLGT